MKRILITGEGSYIGASFEKWVAQWQDNYSVDTVSVRDSNWKKLSFKQYDVILHVAAVVHKKEKDDMKDLYFQVNTELPIKICEKAKIEGVRQFIFMSTMAVYGKEGSLERIEIIDENTKLNPKTYYAKSKVEAENKLMEMREGDFVISIVRPPMVYGANCPGNYSRLRELTLKLPFFPDIRNQRSMIYIFNLCEFIRGVVLEDDTSNAYHPQNTEYVDTSNLVKKMSEANKHTIYLSRIMGKVLCILGSRVGTIQKLFGSLVYSKGISDFNYKDFDFGLTIKYSENEESLFNEKI